MAGDALPGTALADWLERIKQDPEAIERRAEHIRSLLLDPTVAQRVKTALRDEAGAVDPGVVPLWLRAFLVDSGGALSFQLRLGEARTRAARLRRAVFAGASETMLSFMPY